MHPSQKLACLDWINLRDTDQVNWAITYSLKKIRFTGSNIWSLDEIIKIMSTYERKSYLSDMKSAWRTKAYRDASKAGKNGPKKSAFHVRLTPLTLKIISTQSKTLGLTQTQYIENLIGNQIPLEEHYKNKFEAKNINNIKNLEHENTELKIKLEKALNEIEDLRKTTPHIESAIHTTEPNNQTTLPDSGACQSSKAAELFFDLEDTPKSPQAEPQICKIELKRKPVRGRTFKKP